MWFDQNCSDHDYVSYENKWTSDSRISTYKKDKDYNVFISDLEKVSLEIINIEYTMVLV